VSAVTGRTRDGGGVRGNLAPSLLVCQHFGLQGQTDVAGIDPIGGVEPGEVPEFRPTPLDYRAALHLANAEAQARLGESMLLSWYDRDRDIPPRPVGSCVMVRVRAVGVAMGNLIGGGVADVNDRDFEVQRHAGQRMIAVNRDRLVLDRYNRHDQRLAIGSLGMELHPG
jgi:hypothetical protein